MTGIFNENFPCLKYTQLEDFHTDIFVQTLSCTHTYWVFASAAIATLLRFNRYGEIVTIPYKYATIWEMTSTVQINSQVQQYILYVFLTHRPHSRTQAIGHSVYFSSSYTHYAHALTISLASFVKVSVNNDNGAEKNQFSDTVWENIQFKEIFPQTIQ